MFRSTSPSRAPSDARGRILSVFGSGSNKEDRERPLSPTKQLRDTVESSASPSAATTVDENRINAPSTPPRRLSRSSSRRLSSPSLSSAGGWLSRRRSSHGTPSCPNTDSNTPDNDGLNPQLKSPSKQTAHLDTDSPQMAPSALVNSPPGSPAKRAKAIFSSRSRKDSTASVGSRGGSISRPTSPFKRSQETISRPSSPTKALTMLGLSAEPVPTPRIDKASIGLPTNFRHTAGGGLSGPSLDTAITLPPLGSRGDEAVVSHSGDGQGEVYHKNEEQITTWQPRDARLDTVKEVPSGFIQRFENAGQAQALGPVASQRVGAMSLFDSHREASASDQIDVGRKRSEEADLLRPSSPMRSGRRKPVPRVESDEVSDLQTPPKESEQGTTQRPSAVTPTSVRPAAKQSQDWAATLAEISSALSMPIKDTES